MKPIIKKFDCNVIFDFQFNNEYQEDLMSLKKICFEYLNNQLILPIEEQAKNFEEIFIKIKNKEFNHEIGMLFIEFFHEKKIDIDIIQDIELKQTISKFFIWHLQELFENREFERLLVLVKPFLGIWKELWVFRYYYVALSNVNASSHIETMGIYCYCSGSNEDRLKSYFSSIKQDKNESFFPDNESIGLKFQYVNFGQFKNSSTTWSELINTNPNYISWLIQNVSFFSIEYDDLYKVVSNSSSGNKNLTIYLCTLKNEIHNEVTNIYQDVEVGEFEYLHDSDFERSYYEEAALEFLSGGDYSEDNFDGDWDKLDDEYGR